MELINEKIIEELCIKYKINHYTINSDGDVDFSHGNLFDLPLSFNYVSGDFYCSYNELTSLLGSPIEVGGHFECHNNLLTSLEFSPVVIGGSLYCYKNLLTSLEDSPLKVANTYDCSFNEITSLKGAPFEVGGNVFCYNNNLSSLEFSPSSKNGRMVFSGNYYPSEFNLLIEKLNREEINIFIKYHHSFRIWDDGYDHEVATLLCEEIKDGLL